MTPFPLYLLRHGAPELTGRMLGRTDCAVTHAGIAACREQGRMLREGLAPAGPPLHVIASDLIRARHCGEAIMPEVEIDPRWRELDFGAWDGLSTAEIAPEPLGRFWSNPDANPPPQGERWSALLARVGDAIEDMSPRATLVVTHGGAMRAALHYLCGFDLAQLWAFDLPYASMIALRIWSGERRSAQITGLWP